MATSKYVSVNEWLLLGSFPMVERQKGRWLENGYPCEAVFAPSTGETFDGRSWTVWKAEDVDLLDPSIAFQQRQWCFAYALTYVRSPKKQTVRLLMGSDDGIAVWLNTEKVYQNDCQRVFEKFQDTVSVTLNEGWNRLLCKISQADAAWRFHVAVAGATERSPRPGVLVSARRPAGKLLPSLKGRRSGIVLSGGVPSAKVMVDRDGMIFRCGLPLFNDRDQSVRRVKATLADAAGRVLSQGAVGLLEPFVSQTLTLDVDGESFLDKLASGSGVILKTASSLGEGSLALNVSETLSTKLFLELMTGFEIPVSSGAQVFIPQVFRGVPGLVETYSNGEHLPREIPWPKMPTQKITPQQSRTGRIQIDLVIPAGVPKAMGRISFGDEGLVEIQHKVRYLCCVLQADISDCTSISEKGLQALGRKDFESAATALRDLYEHLAAKETDRCDQRVTLIGHGHIDMNWLWTSWETLQCCHDTFRQVLAFMEEFPDFKYSQSQASTYQYIERIDPAMFRKIQERVREGRWEILGGTVDEGDTNLSSGEALARSLLLGQRYFREKFGRIARVSWCPDNFGHAAQLPQILGLAGLKYFYGHRCQPKIGCSNWVGPDGSRLINYSTPTYNGEVDNRLREAPAEYDPEHKSMIWVYGVGDHGGGPSRQDITRAIALQDMPGFPEIRFGTAEEFFKSKESQAKDYPTYQGELQYIFEGCYTSIARIKEGNRRCENLLYATDMLVALMGLDGYPFPQEQLRDAWHKLTFNQFHDILCGSATHEANRESIALYDAAIAIAEEVCFCGLRQLASRVSKKRNNGQPLVVFNSLGAPRTDVV
ncbi:MAG TPA: hypothetical protein PKH07_02390, partial [bacterium]|nr:hypothetical protein [bacterium]